MVTMSVIVVNVSYLSRVTRYQRVSLQAVQVDGAYRRLHTVHGGGLGVDHELLVDKDLH